MNVKKINNGLTWKSGENHNKFIDLCAGAGGLSAGFIANNFKPVLINDNNKQCVETLKLNYPETSVYFGKMENIDLKQYYRKVDVLIAGLPCQAFSQIGKRKGIDDERGKLILNFIQIVKKLKPKIFVVENVPGLLSLNNGQTYKLVIKSFEDLRDWKLYAKVLNANDFSVAQNRKRLFIVGVDKVITKEFQFPKPHTYKPVLKDVLSNCPASAGVTYNKTTYKLLETIPEDGCWVNLPTKKQKDYLGRYYYSSGGKRGILKRLSMKKPSLTLLTTPVQKWAQRCHPVVTRPLQILEYARIQSFPDSYRFSGSVPQIYKQIGNAVPPNLSKAIAEEILSTLS